MAFPVASIQLGEKPARAKLIIALIAASLLLLVGLAWQVTRISVTNLQTATTVLREYASLVADEYARRALAELGYNGYYQTLARLGEAGATAETSPELVMTWFVFEPAQRVVTWRGGEPLDAAIARQLLEHFAELLAESDDEAPYRVVQPSSAFDQTAVLAVDFDRGAGLGFTVRPVALDGLLQQAFDQSNLLPASLGEGAVTNEFIYLEITDPRGMVRLQTEAALDPYLVVEKRLGAEYSGVLNGYRITAAIDPTVANELVIGGLPRSRLPLLAGLLLLTLGLLLTAILLLRRERAVMRMRSDFVSEVSHELRTPLTQIRMFAETLLLGRARSDAERTRALEVINREAQRLIHLVENLLRFSDQEPARALTPVPQPLAPLIERVVAEFAPLAQQHQVEIGCQLDQSVEAAVDADALRQILLNLLDNAVKYGPPGQQVQVLLSNHQAQVQIRVSDQGPGVPTAERDKIWLGYHRLRRERRSAIAGTGIGLSLVRALAEQHGGRAWVEPAPGGGACFIVALPSTEPTVGAP